MWLACVFGVLLFAITPLAARAADPTDTPFSADVQSRIEAAVRHDLTEYGGNQPVPGVVIGVWDPARGSFVRGIGDAQISPQRPMAVDDKFRVGSNTKTFVITVLLQLVDEGKLSLDDPVSKFDLPVKVPNGEHITVRQLMQMRSGLLDLYALPAFQAMTIAPDAAFDRTHWVQLALDRPALFAPGTKWSYSNTNYMLLGMIVEAITHETVATEISKRLLTPMALNNTSFPTTDPQMPTPYAHGYMLDAHNDWVENSVEFPPSVTWAAGVMISDMADMKRWVKAYVTGTTNSAATQRDRLACLPIGKGDLSFGLGIGCSEGWYGYTGGITGYNTGAYYLPSKDATIIAFVNSQREPKGKPDVPNAIVRDIARIVFPENVPFQE
jgi:D-alanyl-D-alanine carboxypeptidase